MDQFWVVGGVFTDGTFSALERDGAECYGPFNSSEAAESTRSARCRHNIDICWYNLFITKQVL